MAHKASVVRGTIEHALTLADSLRADDIEELRVADGSPSPLKALEDGVRLGVATWTIFFGEEIGAMFGVCPIFDESAPPGVGAVWCLTGEAVDRNPVAFLRITKRWLPTLLQYYPILINHIDARHKKALEWAKWAGFHVMPAQPHGPLGSAFHTVIYRRS